MQHRERCIYDIPGQAFGLHDLVLCTAMEQLRPVAEYKPHIDHSARPFFLCRANITACNGASSSQRHQLQQAPYL